MAQFFTRWSWAALAGACAIALACPNARTCQSARTLLAAACVNSLVVGVAGPAVLAYGGLPNSASSRRSNLWEHAVPMAVATLLVLRIVKVRARAVIPMLLLLDLVYLLTPYRSLVGFDKVRAVYRVRHPAWLLLVPVLQCATAVAVEA